MHSCDAAGGAALLGLDHSDFVRRTVARLNTTDAP